MWSLAAGDEKAIRQWSPTWQRAYGRHLVAGNGERYGEEILVAMSNTFLAMATSSPRSRPLFLKKWWENGVHFSVSDERISDHHVARRPPVAKTTFWPFSYQMATNMCVANSIVFCSVCMYVCMYYFILSFYFFK